LTVRQQPPNFDHRNEQYRYGDSNPGFWHEKPAS
jgi:hypothetical protein